MTDKPEFAEDRKAMARPAERRSVISGIEDVVDNAFKAISLKELHAAGCELRTCTHGDCERSFVTQRGSVERLCRHHRKGC